MARIKQVFTSKDEIAHLWAHQTQDHARNSNGSFYFHRKSIYSYGSHFEIARIVEIGVEKVVLWYDHTYSNTTSKHQNAAWYAIPSTHRKIRCEKMPYSTNPKSAGFKDTMLHNLRAHIKTAKELVEKQLRARKHDHTGSIQSHILMAREIATLFRIKSKMKKSEREIVFADDILGVMMSPEQVELIKARQSKARELEKKRRAKELAEAKEQIDKWRAGMTNHCPYVAGYLLRVKDAETIETSRRAEVPMEQAKILWALVNKTKNSDTNWKRNGKTFEIGHYSVDLIQAGTGDITVGCHKIDYEEMNALATQLGWN